MGQTAAMVWEYHLTALQHVDTGLHMATEALGLSCAILLGVLSLITAVVWYARRQSSIQVVTLSREELQMLGDISNYLAREAELQKED